MRILAFETGGDWCGVAVGDGIAWHAVEAPSGQAHSERALDMARAALAEAGWSLSDLDGVAFGAGPGSFTGVRIACGLAQGLAFGTDIPVVPVPTLAALAHATWRRGGQSRVFTCIDARMRELYFAAYTRSAAGWREVAAPAVAAPMDVVAPGDGTWFGAGNGFAVAAGLDERLGITEFDATARATARAVGELALPRLLAGEGVDAGAALPLYVRHRVALTTDERTAGATL